MRQFSATTAYDFDRAVMKLARVIDMRSRETEHDRWEEAPKPPKPGMHEVRKPRYSLSKLLMPEVDEGMDEDVIMVDDEALGHLPAALL